MITTERRRKREGPKVAGLKGIEAVVHDGDGLLMAEYRSENRAGRGYQRKAKWDKIIMPTLTRAARSPGRIWKAVLSVMTLKTAWNWHKNTPSVPVPVTTDGSKRLPVGGVAVRRRRAMVRAQDWSLDQFPRRDGSIPCGAGRR